MVSYNDAVKFAVRQPDKVSMSIYAASIGMFENLIILSPCIMCVQYIGGCSVHRGVFSTSGGVQYIGGIS